jgi:hypothetical protein
MSMNKAAPSTTGTQPPSGILSTLETKKPRSSTRSGVNTAATSGADQPNCRRNTRTASKLVQTKVPVTAMP